MYFFFYKIKKIIIVKSYNKFLSLIKEGLLRIHNIHKHSDALKNNLKFIGFDISLNIINK